MHRVSQFRREHPSDSVPRVAVSLACWSAPSSGSQREGGHADDEWVGVYGPRHLRYSTVHTHLEAAGLAAPSVCGVPLLHDSLPTHRQGATVQRVLLLSRPTEGKRCCC